MLLNRYYKLLLTTIGYHPGAGKTGDGEDVLFFKTKSAVGGNLSGAATLGSIGFLQLGDAMQKVIQEITDGSEGVCFGDGETEVSGSDYFLAGNIITGIDVIEIRVSCGRTLTDDATENISASQVKGVYYLTNTNSEDITIRECCLVTNGSVIGWTDGKTNGTISRSLTMDRTLLDEPITIPAGGTGVITYEIKLNFGG